MPCATLDAALRHLPPGDRFATVREYALGTLSDPDAVLVVDETGFLKQGKSSCGVGRQHTGPAGKVTNCQVQP